MSTLSWICSAFANVAFAVLCVHHAVDRFLAASAHIIVVAQWQTAVNRNSVRQCDLCTVSAVFRSDSLIRALRATTSAACSWNQLSWSCVQCERGSSTFWSCSAALFRSVTCRRSVAFPLSCSSRSAPRASANCHQCRVSASKLLVAYVLSYLFL